MTHYELLGLRPEATDAEVREAIVAARASWARRRDASAAPAAVERATAALARLDEAARDLGMPDLRRQYDESALPLEVLHRVRALRPYPEPATQERSEGAATTGGTGTRGGAPGADAQQADPAEQERIATEQAIRAEAERRREARRQEEERAAHERNAWAGGDDAASRGGAGGTGPGGTGSGGSGGLGGPGAVDPSIAGSTAQPDRRPARKRRKPRIQDLGVEVDWRTVSILALATAAGVGIALVPVALLTTGRPGPTLLSAAATASETPRVLPVTGVSATISQYPSAASNAATDDDPVPPAYAAATAHAAQMAATAAVQTAQVAVTAHAQARGSKAVPTPQPALGQPGVAGIQPAPAAQAPGLGGVPPAGSVGPGAQPPGGPPESAHSVLRRAYAAYSGGRYEESLRLYDQVLARKPDDPIARVARALTMLALSRPHDAEVECRIAIKVQPTFPEAHFNLGIALHRQHRDDEAVAAFRRFVELSPDDKAAPQARGFIARWTMALQAASASRRAGRSGR